MHIIISILKIAGISAIVIVLLLIFLLILFLFVPFYYRLYGCVSEISDDKRNVEAKVTIRFLAFLLMASLEYTEEGLKGVLRILGIPVKRIGGKKFFKGQKEEKEKKGQRRKKWKEKEQKDKEQKDKEQDDGYIKEQKEEEQIDSHIDKEEKGKQIDKDKNKNTEKQEQEKLNDFEKEQGIHKRSRRFYHRLHQHILSIANFWRRFCTTKENIMDVWRNEHVRNGVSILWKQCRRGLRHLLPHSVFLRLHFGCSDPAATGQILGLLSIIYAFYGDTVEIKPDFDQPALDGEAELKGHIQLFLLLRIAWILYRNKEVRYALKRIKGIGEHKEKAENL